MTDYEKLLGNIIINAGEKIIDAAVLLRTDYSYRDSWYLCIIAEEELAKLVIIPFAQRAGNIEALASRPSVLYRHPVKQKVFTTYGLQNRDYEKIESLKQECLYIEPRFGGKYLRVVTKEEASVELERSVLLFNQLAVNNILICKDPSVELRKIIEKFVKHIFAPAIKDLAPEVAKKIMQSFTKDEKISLMEAVKRYPMLFAEMIIFALPDKHKEFFAEIQGLSYDEMLQKVKYPGLKAGAYPAR